MSDDATGAPPKRWPPGPAATVPTREAPVSSRHQLAACAARGAMPVEVVRPGSTPAGIAIVAHGRNGAPGQPQVACMTDAALRRRLIVVAPQLSNSAAGDGAGRPEDFTINGHVAELRAVVVWTQALPELTDLPAAPILMGHSMGAYAALRLAAEDAGGRIGGVVAVSPVVSGASLIAARRRMGAAALQALASEVPGALETWLEHDLLPMAARITVPVAVMTGAADALTPPADAERLARALPNVVALDILANEEHCPSGAVYAASLDRALDRILSACRQP
ncbi:alpha/beta fold hydrolase [Limibaculum sp. M0105]|uniref:Alpha/beta fold hydrolase n=1 Tax=Thermohalobaculum xanthum TaxID=2753746 RepID=A0A8J7SAG6_9RHOB|nr:alpha/beta fold hydrolase [Thermohalobaculum xanthum]MBK0398312.1 alpha/beta fold hydrolase [Thermohalobaculum xanthum]